VVDLYTAPIATYSGNWWTFSLASKKLAPREVRRTDTIETKYYCGDIHINSFLPKGMYAKPMSGKLDW